jgi:aspartyl-tRNA(Asn)/glutamyl-tRNA(Gln) amidotransferase subunit A
MDILSYSIKELSGKLDKQELSSVELTKSYLAQIDKVDGEIHAFLAINKDALKQAEAADMRVKRGKRLSMIDGIPVAIKDVLLTKGITTTASSRMLEHYMPLENATVVQKLLDAGAVIIGKNNCDAWAHGGSTENSDFGPTKNPYDLSRVPGGSSGGSTAAIAANEVPLSIGTDTGGSIRQPAGYCGVVGMKPTYGLCSRYGLIAMASSLDVPGPITKTVYDNAIALSIMGGADPKDATSNGAKIKDYTKNIDKGVKGLKIGLPNEYFADGVSKEVKNAVLAAAGEYKKLGAKIIDISLPMTKYGIATYYVIQPAEVSSNLGRYDGVKYGYSAKNSKNLIDQYFKSRTEGFGDEAKRRIMLGTYVLSAGYYDAYYLKAMKVRTLIKKEFETAFKKVDVILGPTSPATAFKLGEHANDPLAMYLEDVYTVSVNLAGIPSLALPCGKDKEGLPIGMQIMGTHFSEELIYRVANAYEKVNEGEK